MCGYHKYCCSAYMTENYCRTHRWEIYTCKEQVFYISDMKGTVGSDFNYIQLATSDIF